ncbi:hypothetical protein EV361DRAFT_526522 [Lentinula raphanica]|nr:hypothetical protein EV361DRAFT_526522 [Lentinula raphanica]
MRLSYMTPFLYLSLCFPAYIFATPIPAMDTSIQVHPSTAIYARKVAVEESYLVEVIFWSPYRRYTGMDSDSLEFANKIRNAVEILLHWFFLCHRNDKFDEKILPENRMSFRVTSLTYNGAQPSLLPEPWAKDHYRMDLRFTLDLGNKRSSFDDHSLFFLAKVFDEAPTPLLPEDAINLEGAGLWERLDHRHPFVLFKQRQFKLPLSTRYHDRLDFRLDVDELQWEQNRVPTRKTVINSRHVFLFMEAEEGQGEKDKVKSEDGQRGST